jgi:hypothetical protein
MKTETTFDWDDMIEAMVQSALDGHEWFGKGSLDGKDSPEKALADSLQAFSEACYDRLQDLTEGDIT